MIRADGRRENYIDVPHFFLLDLSYPSDTLN